tara:strand:- start:250 stop:756 length:507 start_codon:yes stop_codon:yes gene_type:complete
MSAKDTFFKIFNELYQVKDTYGVNNQAKFFNVITAIITNRNSEGKAPSKIKSQKVEWTSKTNLAIYKEGLGITPIDKLDSLESSVGKRIPLEELEKDFFEYYFIMVRKDVDSIQTTKCKLEFDGGKYVLQDDTDGFSINKNFEIKGDDNKYISFTVQDYLKNMLDSIK